MEEKEEEEELTKEINEEFEDNEKENIKEEKEENIEDNIKKEEDNIEEENQEEKSFIQHQEEAIEFTDIYADNEEEESESDTIEGEKETEQKDNEKPSTKRHHKTDKTDQKTKDKESTKQSTRKIFKPSSNETCKFFVMKSLNADNLLSSMKRKIWATQRKNEKILNDAFKRADHVILIFSINESRHFQGFAKMKSPIGQNDNLRWNDEDGSSKNKWGCAFTVEWFNVYDLPFNDTLHLRNEYNDNKLVKICRDGQELPPSVGFALCRLLEEGERRTKKNSSSTLTVTVNGSKKRYESDSRRDSTKIGRRVSHGIPYSGSNYTMNPSNQPPFFKPPFLPSGMPPNQPFQSYPIPSDNREKDRKSRHSRTHRSRSRKSRRRDRSRSRDRRRSRSHDRRDRSRSRSRDRRDRHRRKDRKRSSSNEKDFVDMTYDEYKNSYYRRLVEQQRRDPSYPYPAPYPYAMPSYPYPGIMPMSGHVPPTIPSYYPGPPR